MYPLNWNLQSFFKNDQEFEAFLQETEKKLNRLSSLLALPINLKEALDLIEEISNSLRQAEAYATCLAAENVENRKAVIWENKCAEHRAAFEILSDLVDRALADLDEKSFSHFVKAHKLQSIFFPLAEKRKHAKERLSIKEESLLQDLSISGYHSWSQLYYTLVGEIKIPFKDQIFSFGQMENKLADGDRTVREEAFIKISQGFKEKELPFSQVLNNLAGFRLAAYKRRGWEILKEPLDENRMSRQTLDAMWDAISKKKKGLLPYLEAKASLLGLEKLSWYDLDAPLSKDPIKYPYHEGSDFIIEKFHDFLPKMGNFARDTLQSGCIEAEDRPKKGPGGFCVEFPLQKTNRIFMTYSDSFTNLSTLAHELGHAYHSHICYTLPEMAQHYKMNVAETASTLAELIVIDGAIASTSDPEKKLYFLDDKISSSIAFLMNIHARYLFETAFYEKRKKGSLLPEELCHLMEESQKNAYLNSLDKWHPYFWAAKLHFYITSVPFYNFPYTFGYLFSRGIYTRLKEENKERESIYTALLEDTGKMDVETLAQKHLGVDLQQPLFWNEAIDDCLKDVDAFLSACKEKVSI